MPENNVAEYSRNDSTGKTILNDIRQIIRLGQSSAYTAVNSAMIETYWNIGKRIVEEEQGGSDRATYGKKIISILSKELSTEFGRGYSERNLRNFRKFYLSFSDKTIWQTCLPNLTWSHCYTLLREDNYDARLWYLNEISKSNWTVRTLDRNISTQYYYRLLQSPKKDTVIADMQSKTSEYQKNQFELLKNPIVAEYLEFRTEDSFSESDLENAILSHIRDFLMEMGRGFAFVSRQQHIITDTQDYYIDLVFYNIELKCYVLIDLKMGTVTHQDVGQMDMYVRMYDELKRKEGDNPTIGILLCSETSRDIARYSVLHDNNNLFMSKYLTYLPTKEQLRAEIEKQKALFAIQHQDKNNPV